MSIAPYFRNKTHKFPTQLNTQHRMSYLSCSQVYRRGKIVLLGGDFRTRLQAELDRLDVAPVHRRVERNVSLRVIERNHFLPSASLRFTPLEENFHRFRTGIFRRLVNGIIAIVARFPWRSSKLRNLIWLKNYTVELRPPVPNSKSKIAHQNPSTFLVVVNSRKMQCCTTMLSALLDVEDVPVFSHHLQSLDFVKLGGQVDGRKLFVV